MISEVPPGAKAWLVIFHRHSTRWVEAICPGRFKHVSLAGFVPGPDVWLVVSWELARMRVGVVADSDITDWMARWAGEGCGILRMKAPEFDFGRWRPRLGLFCISTVAHVLGVRSCWAITPSLFWRALIAQGAEINIIDGRCVAGEALPATMPPHEAESPSPATDGERAGSAGGRRARAA